MKLNAEKKKDWVFKALDEVCEVEYGTRVVKSRDQGTKYPVYGGGGATFSMDEYNRENRMIVSRFAMSPQCVRFVKGKFFLNDSGLTLSPKDNQVLMTEFLNWQLLFLNDSIYALGRGSAQRNLDVPSFKKIQIAIPPIEEQERIVWILDEKFAAIDELTGVTEKESTEVKDLITTKKESVLLSLAKDYKKIKIADCVDLISGPAFKSSGYTEDENGIRLLRGDNIVNQSFRWDGVKKWPGQDLNKYEKFLLETGDIVLAMDRPFVGYGLKHNIVDKADLPLLLVQRVARIRTKDNINNRYLFHIISSQGFIDHLLSGQTGVSVPHISGKQICAYEIPLPPIEVQKEIVDLFDSFYSRIKEFGEILEDRKVNLAELKKSYLQAAFAGKL